MPLPPNADIYLPTLVEEVARYWPAAPIPSFMAGQIEQETCVTLKSAKCWSPTTELKTSREYGFGLGQLTVTERFDNFAEAKKLHEDLRDWSWDSRYDAVFQIRTLVLMNRFNFGKVQWAASSDDGVAFALSAYNGGLGGVLNDRKICQITPDCDPSRWFSNVELTSRKAKVRVGGYGKSFFEINREYVRNVLLLRRQKYAPYMEGYSWD